MYMYRTCAMHVHKYTKHKHANINMNTYTNSCVHGIIKIYAGKKKDTAAHEHEHVLHARTGRMRTSMRSNSTQDTRSTMWNASAQNTWSCTTQTKRSRSRSSNNNNNNNNNSSRTPPKRTGRGQNALLTVSLTRYDTEERKSETEVGRAMMKRAMVVRAYRDADQRKESTHAQDLEQLMGKIDIATSDSGKPFFTKRRHGDKDRETCGVSVAHSAGVVVTALGPTCEPSHMHGASMVDVGVDLEVEDRRIRVPVWRRFHETERVFVETGRCDEMEDEETSTSAHRASSEEPQQRPRTRGGKAMGWRRDGEGEISPVQLRRFLLLWTIKEAVAKKRGTGIDLEKIGSIRIGFGRPSSANGVLSVHVIGSNEEILVVRVADARVSSGSAAAIVAVCADGRQQSSRDGGAHLTFEAEFVPDVLCRDTDSLPFEVLATSDGWVHS